MLSHRSTALVAFEACRPELLAMAYRMLGDFGRAEDMVQDAWLRWERRSGDVEAPRAFLLKVVSRLCLNELNSARVRREESRGDRLPEPVDLAQTGLDVIDTLDQISMAFLVLLQRLTPSERAVLLLHDVFDFSYEEIGGILKKSEPACRQALSRARENVARERRSLSTSPEEHRRLLQAFVRAASAGDQAQLLELLSDDAVLIADGGPDESHFGRLRNFPGPVTGAVKVAAVLAAVTPQGSVGLTVRECELNGQPAVLVLRDDRPHSAILLAVSDSKICSLFIHADASRLGHVGHA